MRSVLISILLVLSVMVSGQVTRAYAYQVTPSASVIPSSEIDYQAYWKFDGDLTEESGVFDGTGSGVTYQGDTAALFAGSAGTSYIDAGIVIPKSTYAITIDLEFYMAEDLDEDRYWFGTGLPLATADSGIYSRFDGAGDGTYNMVNSTFWNHTGSSSRTDNSGCDNDIKDASWHHLTQIWYNLDNSDNTANLVVVEYIDGVCCNCTGSADSTISYYCPAIVDDTLFIGNTQDDGTSGLRSGDLLDEVKIFLYDIRDLGIGYIDSLNNNPYRMPFSEPEPEPETGAQSIWLCENNGDDEKENNDISLYGSAAWSTDADIEGTYGLNADCSNCGASIPTSDYGDQFTILGHTRKYGFGGEITLFSAYQNLDGFELSCATGTPSLRFKTGNGTSSQTATSSTISITSGQWFSWAAVADRTAGTVDFYINGSFVSSGTVRTDFETSTIARIGVSLDDSGDSWCQHDAPQVYHRKLTSTEISTIHTTPGTEVFE